MPTCPKCNGSGKMGCTACDGKGNKYHVPALGFWEADCSVCYGLGHITCPECEGRGEVMAIPPSALRKLESSLPLTA